MRTARIAIAVAALSGLPPAIAVAQEPARPAEIQRLQFYVGSWSEKGRMREDAAKAFAPIAGGETCRWGAGGYAVVREEKTSGPGGGFEGVYILSYDAAAKTYNVYGTEKPGSNVHAVGRVEGDRWSWLTDPGPDGSRLRYSFAPKGPNARTLTVETGAGDRWDSIIDVEYTRRK